MVILKLYYKYEEVGEIKFRDDEKFLLACDFAQKWRDKGQEDHCFNISFKDLKIPEDG
jgi:hypothetical protein